MVLQDILERIGNTSLVALRRLAPANGTRLLLKLECENPTGSMKDRMALAMIEAAERDGRLPPGGPVVEYTGGSTGVSLSLVCAVKGHPLHVVSSNAFAREKLDHMAILGARLTVIASDGGRMTAQLTKVLSGGASGAHGIDGVGAGFVVPLWDPAVPNQIERVSTDEAKAMALRLAREDGIFAGTSTGANVVAVLRVAETLPPGSTLVTVMCDTGMKYLTQLRTGADTSHPDSNRQTHR